MATTGLRLFYNLDQLVGRARNRSFLLLNYECAANPMIDLRRKPHKHLYIAISRRVLHIEVLDLSIDFESLKRAGRRRDGFLGDDLGQA